MRWIPNHVARYASPEDRRDGGTTPLLSQHDVLQFLRVHTYGRPAKVQHSLLFQM